MVAPDPSQLESTPCVVCRGTHADVVLTGHDNRRRLPGEFSVVRCRECGLAYINPRPTPENIGQYYPSDYSYHEAGPASAARQFYYRLFRRVPIPRGGRVLDVGCGGGSYLLHLRGLGYEVAGVEPNAEVAAYL